MSQSLEQSETGTPIRRSRNRKARYFDVVDDLADVLAGIPERPTKGLMTFDELKAKIGAAPKADRLGGAWKMSARYKDIGAKLDAARATLDGVTLGQISAPGGREDFETDLGAQLDAVVAAANAYRKKHKGKKAAAVGELLTQADKIRDDIKATLDGLLIGRGTDLPPGLPLDQAAAAKRLGLTADQFRGVSPKHCDFAGINDGNADADPVELGKGAVNTVHLITNGGVERVFKEEKPKDTSGAHAPIFMGIDSQNDPRYGNRNVGSGAIAAALGTSVVPQSRFGISGGKVGLVMDKAPGETLKDLLKKKAIGEDTLSPKATASLQRQLADMEACDIIAGQADRHAGNYLVDIQGDNVTVTAIDNDFAFPDTTKALGNKTAIPLVFQAMNSIRKLPMLLDKAIAEKIKATDFDRDVRPGLVGALTDNELDGAATRLAAMQAHVRTLESTGCIVTDWQTWRLPPNKSMNASEYLAQDAKGSLFGRDLGGALGLR